MKVVVETSARHLHVSQEHLEILFGKGYQLTNKKDLSQPGQFACAEKVEVVGPKGSLKMSILGPVRPATQIEIAKSEARTLGVAAPIRESGKTEGTPGCKLVGPCGEVDIAEGCIIAMRHIHFDTATANEMGIKDKQIVKVKINSERTTIFDDVVCRVSDSYAPAMHIDTDECNACSAFGEVYGEILD